MVVVQIHELISTSDKESDQPRASTTDKGSPSIISIGSCLRSLAVMNALWRRAWPDAHFRTVTIGLLFTVCVCVCMWSWVCTLALTFKARYGHGQVH
jgi:hypothetical protein